MCLSLNSNIVICNPATREFRLLPQPPCHSWHTNYLGFAFDSRTNDYKVVRVATLRKIGTNDYKVVRVATRRETMRVCHNIHIYYMSADSWKELVIMAHNHNFTGYHHHPCTLLDGVFYWLSSNVYPHGSSIDALNTVEGSFERKSLPVGVGSHSWTNLCLLNDSLALVVPLYERQGKTQFDVWLMDEYGVPECWTKKYTIGPILGIHRPFGFHPNNEVLMTGCDYGLIVSYNHSTGDIKVYKQLCNWPELIRCSTQVFQYSESLVSVKRRST
ncbi:hypothetical protein RHGRI_028670 [Rhododendron griersonianum]|uniref:F-box associated beta-propeller type 1 domain-containing protein n=1 Tax=Rhododendron griersonianum TaxID=479676 RepID=A0AAV6IGK3_9ERIC|nr:hypothetical protein RHGRI_028670 [Rhododendron griersonianum]